MLLLVAPAFPLAKVGGAELGGPGNAWAFVPPLPLVALRRGGWRAGRPGPAAAARPGRAVPGRHGRRRAAAAEVALLRTGSHSTLDLPLGIGTSSRYEVGPGLVVPVSGTRCWSPRRCWRPSAWPRTIMEDGGDLDPRRPRLAAWGLAVGVLTALVLGMAPYSSPIAPGAPTLPERHGLDLLGAAVVALGAAAWAVLAATLRPRLAVVGAYAGLAATLLTLGLANGLLVARSDALGPPAPGGRGHPASRALAHGRPRGGGGGRRGHGLTRRARREGGRTRGPGRRKA